MAVAADSMRTTTWSIAFGGAMAAALLGGCRPAAESGDGRLRVAVSVVPQAWLVRAIAGDRVDVVSLVIPGESPHTYQPTDAQVSRVMQSAVFFRIGATFETAPWFKAIQQAGRPKVVDLRDGLPLLDMKPHHEEGGHDAHAGHECSLDGKDPHVWLSARRLKIQAATVARTLAELDPQRGAEYDRRCTRFQADMDALDQRLRDKLARLPGKAFFVMHPAWGYLADDYGLRQVAAEIEGKEPSDRELTELQRDVRETGAKVIFVQPQFSARAAQAIAAATGIRVEKADSLEEDVAAGLERMAEALLTSYK